LRFASCFIKLRDYAVSKHVTRSRFRSVFYYFQQRQLVQTFTTLKNYSHESKIRSYLKNKAFIYRQLCLQQKSLIQLRGYTSRIRRERNLVNAFLQNRLLPIAFTSLKLHKHLEQTQRGLNIKANLFRKRKLLY